MVVSFVITGETSLMLTGLLLTACGGATPAKTYSIGVVNYYQVLEPVLAGFKAKMIAIISPLNPK